MEAAILETFDIEEEDCWPIILDLVKTQAGGRRRGRPNITAYHHPTHTLPARCHTAHYTCRFFRLLFIAWEA